MSDTCVGEKNKKIWNSIHLFLFFETNTANMYIPDSDGTNRLKRDFLLTILVLLKLKKVLLGNFKNSIDRTLNELRPNHFTDSRFNDGPVATTDPSQDLLFSGVEGNNIRKNNNILTLSYLANALKQPLLLEARASPFFTNFWQGTIDLIPDLLIIGLIQQNLMPKL